MSPNRIAVYGHRGLFSSRIVSALIASDAHITVLYRPGSDVSNLPASVPKIEVDVLDQDGLVAALQNIDIVLSLVGDEGVSREFGFVQAIPRTNVKLFVPSVLGLRYGEDGMAIPILRKKEQVQEAARQAGIPLTVVRIANFAEFTLGSIVMGIDVEGNRLLYTGNAAAEKASMCTVDYVAAAYVSIFATTPIAEISNRAIGLVELAPTGEEIAAALQKKHGKKPKIFRQSIEKVMEEFSVRLKSDLSALAPAWYYRKLWGTGELTSLLGSDIWDLPWYKKATLDDLIVEGKVGRYRDLSHALPYFEEAMFR
ncbi:nmrA-like family protein [Macrophomina phaseolina]|uniref:NmrA-like family protein n=1 Tax=Macrophomina phaseolina TaxID=35725 RepID=A0ABQ8G3B9_9PEZI|nr:nmrA-like family protein [Macrophomina phaseolina]